MIKKDNYLSYEINHNIYTMSIKDKYFSTYTIVRDSIEILKEKGIGSIENYNQMLKELSVELDKTKISAVDFPLVVTIEMRNENIKIKF